MSNPELTKKRARTGIVLVALASSAYFLAAGSSQLVASALFDGATSTEVASATVSAAPTPRRADRSLEPVLTRNIFDSTTGALQWDPPAPPEPEASQESVEEAPPAVEDIAADHSNCEGSIRLVGSYVRVRDPEESFASIINATGTSLLYRAGMSVDSREVVSIERHRVVTRPGGALCHLRLFGTGPAVAVAATPEPPTDPAVVASAADGSGLDAAELDANIHQVSDTSFTVNRALVDRLLQNQAALMSMARVIPHEEDGRTVGMKIYGIRRSSLLGRLGVQNGDMLRSINGFDMTDPNTILQAYTQLRSAERLSMQLVRRGSPMSMDYQIQ